MGVLPVISRKVYFSAIRKACRILVFSYDFLAVS